jgi:hypothetical protein
MHTIAPSLSPAVRFSKSPLPVPQERSQVEAAGPADIRGICLRCRSPQIESFASTKLRVHWRTRATRQRALNFSRLPQGLGSYEHRPAPANFESFSRISSRRTRHNLGADSQLGVSGLPQEGSDQSLGADRGRKTPAGHPDASGAHVRALTRLSGPSGAEDKSNSSRSSQAMDRTAGAGS